jgi:mycoredoxin
MSTITLYGTGRGIDCWRAKLFLRERGVAFVEVNIEGNPDAEKMVLEVNHGTRKVPTIRVGDRYFACSPFNPARLAHELDIPLNP